MNDWIQNGLLWPALWDFGPGPRVSALLGNLLEMTNFEPQSRLESQGMESINLGFVKPSRQLVCTLKFETTDREKMLTRSKMTQGSSPFWSPSSLNFPFRPCFPWLPSRHSGHQIHWTSFLQNTACCFYQTLTYSLKTHTYLFFGIFFPVFHFSIHLITNSVSQ